MKAEEWSQVTCLDCKTIYSGLLGIEQIKRRWIVNAGEEGKKVRLSNFRPTSGGHLSLDNDVLNEAGDVLKRKSVGLLCQVLKHMK